MAKPVGIYVSARVAVGERRTGITAQWLMRERGMLKRQAYNVLSYLVLSHVLARESRGSYRFVA